MRQISRFFAPDSLVACAEIGGTTRRLPDRPPKATTDAAGALEKAARRFAFQQIGG